LKAIDYVLKVWGVMLALIILYIVNIMTKVLEIVLDF